uniref:Uncharacterized protein n=1 Tax=Anopheles atroparvus TaxID=41427 RepID=A0A182JKM9_ANOAO
MDGHSMASEVSFIERTCPFQHANTQPAHRDFRCQSTAANLSRPFKLDRTASGEFHERRKRKKSVRAVSSPPSSPSPPSETAAAGAAGAASAQLSSSPSPSPLPPPPVAITSSRVLPRSARSWCATQTPRKLLRGRATNQASRAPLAPEDGRQVRQQSSGNRQTTEGTAADEGDDDCDYVYDNDEGEGDVGAWLRKTYPFRLALATRPPRGRRWRWAPSPTPLVPAHPSPPPSTSASGRGADRPLLVRILVASLLSLSPPSLWPLVLSPGALRPGSSPYPLEPSPVGAERWTAGGAASSPDPPTYRLRPCSGRRRGARSQGRPRRTVPEADGSRAVACGTTVSSNSANTSHGSDHGHGSNPGVINHRQHYNEQRRQHRPSGGVLCRRQYYGVRKALRMVLPALLIVNMFTFLHGEQGSKGALGRRLSAFELYQTVTFIFEQILKYQLYDPGVIRVRNPGPDLPTGGSFLINTPPSLGFRPQRRLSVVTERSGADFGSSPFQAINISARRCTVSGHARPALHYVLPGEAYHDWLEEA